MIGIFTIYHCVLKMLYLWKDHSGVVNNNLYEAGRHVVPLACLKPRIIYIQNREPFGSLSVVVFKLRLLLSMVFHRRNQDRAA